MKRATEKAKQKMLRSISLTVAILLIRFISIIASNWLIIRLGVRIYHNIQIVELGALLISAVISAIRVGFFGFAIANQKQLERQDEIQKREQERREAEFLREYADDSTSPELTRQMLEEICDGTTEMNMLVQECKNYMNMMDLLQKKQGVLIKTNNATYLNETVEVLNRVETRLCQDIRSIINLCITAENIRLEQEAINGFLRDAESRVSDAKQLLKLSGEWVNSYNEKDSRNDGNEVKLWIKNINRSLKEG